LAEKNYQPGQHLSVADLPIRHNPKLLYNVPEQGQGRDLPGGIYLSGLQPRPLF